MDEDDDREITKDEFMHYFGIIPAVENNWDLCNKFIFKIQ